MGGAVPDEGWPSRLAESRLSSLSDRWQHVRAVACRAATVTDAVAAYDRQLLVAAAWLHDVGYSSGIRATGFHPLDGARYLESLGADRRLCCLVAHHSGARFEAEERGLADELAVFEREEGPVMDALVYADMTIGPQGQQSSFDQRISEILTRYSSNDPVHRAVAGARPALALSVARTEGRLAAVPH